MKHSQILITVILLLISTRLLSIDLQYHEAIDWKTMQQVEWLDGAQISRPVFDGALFDEGSNLPHFNKNYPIHTAFATAKISIEQATYTLMTQAEQEALMPSKNILKQIVATGTVIKLRKEPWLSVDMIPIRWNDTIQGFEKLVSFNLVAEITDTPEPANSTFGYASQSVLATGTWYKIRISETGMYKLTYNELHSMGFDMNTNSANIALFGNGGGTLPEKNDDPIYDDLMENPIQMVDGGDGTFDPGDYFLFYGQGPVIWKWNTGNQAFYHINNYYSDYAYYFITALNQPAKRIQSKETPAGNPVLEVNDFIDYAYHEEDTRNIAGVGRIWYGELYDLSSLTYDFIFTFPDIIQTSNSGYFFGSFASDASSSNSFAIDINGINMANLSLGITSGAYDFGKTDTTNFRFLPKSENILVSTTFKRNNTSSVGYLDYIELNVRRKLSMTGNQMPFRNVHSDINQVASYNLNSVSEGTTVWDVSTPVNPMKVITQFSGNIITFNCLTAKVNEFIAFNQSDFKSVEFDMIIANQNLHAIRNIDYLIVTHPDFLEQANRLAEFHRSHSQLETEVVTIDQIYNEFSSGAQDITAIRNMAKMLYEESNPGAELKYMLMFGDASYDYKDRLSDNSNFVPCWESTSAPLNIVNSIASDDYFGYLDDGEGIENDSDNRVDIGIGRFVVASQQEAIDAVDKTIHYSVNSTTVMAPWRNVITFVADDGDSNIHMSDAEYLSDFIGTNFPVYNINKIYVDAYEQTSTPGGQKAPAVNRAINLQMNKGTLIFNYSGHGGEIGLGHEQIVQISDINSWNNWDKLAIFITATCEFTRYDDPTRVSAGEQVFLNPKGGGIALFTTTRATYSGANLAINKDIYEDNLFEKIDGNYPALGDVIRKSKRRGSANDKKFILVGDPACSMVYPENRAETTEINLQPVTENPDTLSALDMVSIAGRITDQSGTFLQDFQGEIFPLVYDKLSEVITYGDESTPRKFFIRKNILFNGKASIENGRFSFEFMMPRDIAYKYGPGRISYYFRNDETDGNGYDENFIVGGINPFAKEDTIGPLIDLYMFDTTFLPGGVVNESPILLAKVSDESGINTTGSGIGHDIVTTIDDDPNLAYILNDYYEANENSFNSGIINYPFDALADGEHQLSLKVWDVYNNSSIAYLPFVVVSSAQVIVDNLYNFPNPFSQSTQFAFTHNQAGNELDVIVHIYRLDGSLVKSLETKIDAEGYQIEPLTWDGTTDDGGKIGVGFCVYRVVVRNKAGQTGQDQSKLIYIKQ